MSLLYTALRFFEVQTRQKMAGAASFLRRAYLRRRGAGVFMLQVYLARRARDGGIIKTINDLVQRAENLIHPKPVTR